MNHSTSKRSSKATPQVESTILVEGIDKKLIKCTARKAFTVGNSSIKEGETFFLVASERRENRYYVVHFSSDRNQYQCSCGANCKDHAHLKVVREHVTPKVTKVEPVVVLAPKVEQTSKFDGSRQITAEEWKAIQKADRKRQKAWQDEYRQQAAALLQTG